MLKNEKGFTLIEMLVVMMIITVLLLLIIPNLTSQSENIDEKGCDALVAVVQAQTDAYYFEVGNYPSDVGALSAAGYLNENQTTCGDKTTINIDTNGLVTKVENES